MRRITLLAAGAAIGTSALLIVLVVARGVGINLLNGWTILLGLAAGFLIILRPSELWSGDIALLLLVLAVVPALVGGVGLLYIPSIALIGLARQRNGHRGRREG